MVGGMGGGEGGGREGVQVPCSCVREEYLALWRRHAKISGHPQEIE